MSYEVVAINDVSRNLLKISNEITDIVWLINLVTAIRSGYNPNVTETPY